MPFRGSSRRRCRLCLPDARWREAVARARALRGVPDGALSPNSLAAALLLHAVLVKGLIGLGPQGGGVGAQWMSPSIQLVEPEPAREFEPVFPLNPELIPPVESEAPSPPRGPPLPSAEKIAEYLTVPVETAGFAPRTPGELAEVTLEFLVADLEPAAQNADINLRYWAAIRARIADHLFYPRAARAKGIVGTVELELELDAQGMPLRIDLPPEAPHILALAVERAVWAAAPFEPPAPGVPRRAVIPIRFDMDSVP